MPIVAMGDLLQHARRQGYAVGAFDVVSIDFLTAVVATAEARRAPVILGISESHLRHLDPIALMPAIESVARHARVPVAIQYGRATSPESVERAQRLGCSGIALAAAHDDYERHVACTRALCAAAHARDLVVEAGLNVMTSPPGRARAYDAATPDAAREFVERTAIDVFNLGAAQESVRSGWRPERRDRGSVPSAMNGGPGLSRADYDRWISSGVVKIGFYASLSARAAQCLRQNVKSTHRDGYLRLTKGLQSALGREVEECLGHCRSDYRAADALLDCQTSRPAAATVLNPPAPAGVAGMPA